MICWCIFRWWLITGRCRRCWQLNVKNKYDHHVCYLTHLLEKLVTDQYPIEYSRSWVHCTLISNMRIINSYDTDGRDTWSVYSPHWKTQVRLNRSWRPPIIHKNGNWNKVFSQNQTHYVEISPLQIPRKIGTSGCQINTNLRTIDGYTNKTTQQWSVSTLCYLIYGWGYNQQKSA